MSNTEASKPVESGIEFGKRRWVPVGSHTQVGLNLLGQLVCGKNALRVLDVFPCNIAEHNVGCECFWEQCEAWAKTAKAATVLRVESQPAEPTWLAEMKKTAAMFLYFSWPNCMSFSEAIAEQLVQMTRLDSAATQPAWQPSLDTGLIPCRHCGEHGSWRMDYGPLPSGGSDPIFYRAECSHCGIRTLNHGTKEAARAVWNNVPAPPTQPLDFCYAEGDEGSQFCGSPKARHCHVLGTTAYWESFAGQQHLVECMQENHLIHHQFVDRLVSAEPLPHEFLPDNDGTPTCNFSWRHGQRCSRFRGDGIHVPVSQCGG